MKDCRVCGALCEDEADFCPVCGAELVPQYEEIEQSPDEEREIENPVLLASVEDMITGEIVKDLLRENGIPFFFDEEGATMKAAFGGMVVSQDLFVDESDWEAADALYQQAVNSEALFDDWDEEAGEGPDREEEAEE